MTSRNKYLRRRQSAPDLKVFAARPDTDGREKDSKYSLETSVARKVRVRNIKQWKLFRKRSSTDAISPPCATNDEPITLINYDVEPGPLTSPLDGASPVVVDGHVNSESNLAEDSCHGDETNEKTESKEDTVTVPVMIAEHHSSDEVLAGGHVLSFTDSSLTTAQFRRSGCHSTPGSLTPRSSAERQLVPEERSRSANHSPRSSRAKDNFPPAINKDIATVAENLMANGSKGQRSRSGDHVDEPDDDNIDKDNVVPEPAKAEPFCKTHIRNESGSFSSGSSSSKSGSDEFPYTASKVSFHPTSETVIFSCRNNIADGEPDITRDLFSSSTLRLSTHSDVSLSNSNASEFEQSFERARDILGGYDLASSKDFESSRDFGRNGHQGDNVSDGSSNYTANNNKSSKTSTEKKKKSSNWYNGISMTKTKRSSQSKVLSPTYKSRSEDFKRIFKDIPNEERLVVDYSCALQKDILVHGRLYVTQNWICFYANIFRWETVLTIKCKDITSMTKEKTARVIPNAVQICTRQEKLFFTSFGARDKTFLMLFRVWQNALLDQPMHPQEVWQWVHHSYGDELGLTSSDDDYIHPMDEDGHIARLTVDDLATPLAIQPEKGRKYSMPEVLSRRTSSDAYQQFRAGKRMSVPAHLIGQPISSDEENVEDSENLLNGSMSQSNATTPPSEKTASSYERDAVSVGNSSLEGEAVSEKTKSSSAHGGSHMKAVTPDATSGDLPTDIGDTTDDSDGEVACSGHDHSGFTALNEIFQISVDQMFELLFTDTEFFREFIKDRKSYDLVQSSWPDEPDSEGNKLRVISYTISLNYSVGPKFSASTEKQIYYGQCNPGIIYVIDTETMNNGIPYADHFLTANRYCITRVSQHKCRLRINSQIKYRKNTWGFVKNMIEKNATNGINENFALMAEHLRREQERQAQLVTGQQPRKRLRRRKRTHMAGEKTPSIKKAAGSKLPQDEGPSTKDDWLLKLNAEGVVRTICGILLVLVLFNVLLFYKLYSLENRAGLIMYSSQDILDIDDRPRSHEEWVTLLEQQRHLHEQEIDRWKDVLSASVQLMDQMKHTLEDLHATIEKRSQFFMDTRHKQSH